MTLSQAKLHCALLWNVSVQFLEHRLMHLLILQRNKTKRRAECSCLSLPIFRALDLMKSTLKYLSDLASFFYPGTWILSRRAKILWLRFKTECTWSLHLRGSTTVGDFSLTSPAARLQSVRVNRNTLYNTQTRFLLRFHLFDLSVRLANV